VKEEEEGEERRKEKGKRKMEWLLSEKGL